MRQIDMAVLGMAFHRLESPTQTRSDAVKQVASGEIWGRPARGSDIPSVKAYRNALPAGQRGVEFTTAVLPQKGSGTPYEARWYYPNTPGVLRRQDKFNQAYTSAGH
jgi:hypothetical protein